MKNLLRLLLVIILPQNTLAQKIDTLSGWKNLSYKSFISNVRYKKNLLQYDTKRIFIDSTCTTDNKYLVIRTATITTLQKINRDEKEIPIIKPITDNVKCKYNVWSINANGTYSPLNKISFIDSINEQFLQIDSTEVVGKNRTLSLFIESMSKNNIQKKYRILQRQEKPKALILQVGMMNGWASKTTWVDEHIFDNQTELNFRQNNERSRYGFAFTAGLRQEFKKVHSIFANYLFIRQGFVADNAAIDWHTGLPIYTNHSYQDYVFDKSGFEVGYSYCGYKNLINLGVELGLFSLWNYSYNYESMNVRSLGLKQYTWGGKLAIGPVIKTNKGLEICIMPSIYYDFKAINRGYIRTNLYNIGLFTNIAYSIFRY